MGKVLSVMTSVSSVFSDVWHYFTRLGYVFMQECHALMVSLRYFFMVRVPGFVQRILSVLSKVCHWLVSHISKVSSDFWVSFKHLLVVSFPRVVRESKREIVHFGRWLWSQCIKVWQTFFEDVSLVCRGIWIICRSLGVLVTAYCRTMWKLCARGMLWMQNWTVTFLQIPTSYPAWMRASATTALFPVLQKIWETPVQLESAIEPLSPISKLFAHVIGLSVYTCATFVLWPWIYHIQVLPWAVQDIQWIILSVPLHLTTRSFFIGETLSWTVPLSISQRRRLILRECTSILTAAMLILYINPLILDFAPGAARVFALATSVAWLRYYIRHPIILYSGPSVAVVAWWVVPMVLAISAGPIIWFLTKAIASNMAALYLAAYWFDPFIFERALFLSGLVSSLMLGYSAMRMKGLNNAIVIALFTLYAGPMVAVLAWWVVPMMVMYLIYNTWLSYTLLGFLCTTLAMVGVNSLDHYFANALKSRSLNVLQLVSSLAFLYMYLFSIMYAFCFTMPYLSMVTMFSVTSFIAILGFSIVLLAYAVNRAANLLANLAPHKVKPSSVQHWLVSAIALGVFGNIGYQPFAFTFVPAMFVNVSVGVMLGFAGGILSAYMAIQLIVRRFPRVNFSIFYECVISGIAVVCLPYYFVTKVIYMPISSLVLTVGILKTAACVQAIQVLYRRIPLYLLQNSRPVFQAAEVVPAAGSGHQHGVPLTLKTPTAPSADSQHISGHTPSTDIMSDDNSYESRLVSNLKAPSAPIATAPDGEFFSSDLSDFYMLDVQDRSDYLHAAATGTYFSDQSSILHQSHGTSHAPDHVIESESQNTTLSSQQVNREQSAGSHSNSSHSSLNQTWQQNSSVSSGSQPSPGVNETWRNMQSPLNSDSVAASGTQNRTGCVLS